MSEEEGLRLQVFMARAGVGSRRHCEELIKAGRVSINGRTVERMGVRVGLDDVVRLDGRSLRLHEPGWCGARHACPGLARKGVEALEMLPGCGGDPVAANQHAIRLHLDLLQLGLCRLDLCSAWAYSDSSSFSASLATRKESTAAGTPQ